MEKAKIYEFLKQHKLAVVCSVSTDGKPESALVGIAVSEDLEIVFDTLKTSRKYKNLLQNPNAALVIGWDDETSVQYEGIAKELAGRQMMSAGKFITVFIPMDATAPKTGKD